MCIRDRFILVQLAEALDFDNKDQKSGYIFCERLGLPTLISSITKERLKRSAGKVSASIKRGGSQIDAGFRTLKIDTSNLAEVYSDIPQVLSRLT